MSNFNSLRRNLSAKQNAAATPEGVRNARRFEKLAREYPKAYAAQVRVTVRGGFKSFEDLFALAFRNSSGSLWASQRFANFTREGRSSETGPRARQGAVKATVFGR